MHVVITGGSGLVGRRVVQELQQASHSVAVFDLAPPDAADVAHVAGDILSLAQLEAAFAAQQAVVHLAALPDPGAFAAERLFEVNVMGTFNVLEAAARAGIKKVVMASTDSTLGFMYGVHGRQPIYLPIDEEHPLQPEDPYGLGKMIGEEICRSYTRRHGMTTVCLRLTLVWEPDRGADLAWIIDKARERAHGLWAYVYSRDAARAFRLALESDMTGHATMFIAAADSLARESLVDLVAEFYPHVETRAKVDEIRALISHAKANRLLGYTPLHSWRQSLY